MTLLEVKNLAVQYGRVPALQNVSLTVEQGSALTVLGRNGAGKSTLLHAIMGSTSAATGDIMWRGERINKWQPHRRLRAGMALVPEDRRIFPDLTVLENLRLGGFTLNRPEFAAARQRVTKLFPLLEERIDAPAGSLSGGQQQMLAIGRALMSGATLLMLDEPSLGLAPLIVQELYAQLQTLREQGITIILVEQQAQRALRFADEAIVLNLGQVVLQEKPTTLLQDPRLAATYMGFVP